MATFDAATAVESMDYDFTAFGGTAGRIPEPTNDQVANFFDAIAAMGRKVGMDKDPDDPTQRAELAEMVANMSDEDVKSLSGEFAQAVHNLCSGTPSADEYRNLPFRVQGAFTAWLAGQLRPEPQRPGTTR